MPMLRLEVSSESPEPVLSPTKVSHSTVVEFSTPDMGCSNLQGSDVQGFQLGQKMLTYSPVLTY